jgi:hypothetical protein
VLLRGLGQVEKSTAAVADQVRQALRDANADRR